MISLFSKRKNLDRSIIYVTDIHTTSPGAESSSEPKIVRNYGREGYGSTELFDRARRIFYRAREAQR